MTGETCSSCGASTAAEDLVRLWDGHFYCRNCTMGACPGLFEYARRNPILADRIGPGWKPGLVYHLALSVGVVELFAVVMMCGGAPPVAAILFSLLLGTLAFLIQVPLSLVVSDQSRPTVRIRDGVVTVERSVLRTIQWEFSLAEFTWSIGRIAEDRRLIMSHMLSCKPAVLLRFSEPRWWWFRKKHCAPCGDTVKMQAIWVAFLTLARVPRS